MRSAAPGVVSLPGRTADHESVAVGRAPDQHRVGVLADRRQNGRVDLHRDALRAIAAREPLRAWGPGLEDLPWGDPAFSERMLSEHLTQDHELASRRLDTIDRQVELLRG